MNGSAVRRLRVVHVVYSFSIGGLENVIVQLINRLPAEEFEHVVVSLTTISDFRLRIERPDVRYVELHKPPGHAVPLYPRIIRLLRSLRPDVVHTCNFAALEIAPLVRLAGVRRYIHAEHGWDMNDRMGSNPRYRALRRFYRRFTHHQVAVSQDIFDYLHRQVGVATKRLSLIANGVDLDLFAPVASSSAVPGCPFVPGEHWLVGTIGRLQAVKNQPFLARAFARAVKSQPEAASRMRLVIVGDGPLRAEVQRILEDEGVARLAWLAGSRDDVPDILRMLDCFVLPSYAEGTSCTLQEAMAAGLPVIATDVGGNPGLVSHEVNGHLVEPDDDEALARLLLEYFGNPIMVEEFSTQSRLRAVRDFGIEQAVAHYHALFSG